MALHSLKSYQEAELRCCKSILGRPPTSFWGLGRTPAHTQAPTQLGLVFLALSDNPAWLPCPA